jgi:hypothetical protein
MALTKSFEERIAKLNELTVIQSRGANDLKGLVYKGLLLNHIFHYHSRY